MTRNLDLIKRTPIPNNPNYLNSQSKKNPKFQAKIREMENQNQLDTINKELTSIENNPNMIQNEILNNIDTQNTQKPFSKALEQMIWHSI